MRNIIIGICLLAPLMVWGQQLAYSFSVDTSEYRLSSDSYVFKGPEYDSPVYSILHPSNHNPDLFLVFQKKNTDQYDIFSLTGKIASLTLPLPSNIIEDKYFSQTFIDSDSGWECLSTRAGVQAFSIVLDDNGNQLLADSGTAFYGFDGLNTYVCIVKNQYSFKTWRFRTNVSTTSPGNLAKTSSTPRPIIAYLPNGNFRVALQPSSKGQTSIQIFDMLGRLNYSKIIQNINTPVSFIVPSSQVPPGPLIAKIKNNDNLCIERQIPVR